MTAHVEIADNEKCAAARETKFLNYNKQTGIGMMEIRNNLNNQ